MSERSTTPEGNYPSPARSLTDTRDKAASSAASTTSSTNTYDLTVPVSTEIQIVSANKTKQKKKKKTHNWGDPRIFFVEASRDLRHEMYAYSKKLPPYFYRVTHEKSATPSRYEINDLHISHQRKIEPGLAFMAFGIFTFEAEINLSRYERHHKWLMQKDPSSYISVSDNFSSAAGRCRWASRVSKRAARRATVVEITTAGLVAAEYETDDIDPDTGDFVRVPIWVRDTCRPADGSSITTEQWEKSGADVYLSVLEQRCGGLRTGPTAKHGQDHEFMAGGFISEDYVTKVMPFDGHIVHEDKPDHVLRNLLDSDYVFRWEEQRWRYEPLSKKRNHAGEEDSSVTAFRERQKKLQGEIQIDRAFLDTFADQVVNDICCADCSQETAKEHLRDKLANFLADLDISSVFKNKK